MIRKQLIWLIAGMCINSVFSAAAIAQEPLFVLADTGRDYIVDYEQYGTFSGKGSKDYRYRVTDNKGLTAAVGQGIFPNTRGVRNDPLYKKLAAEKKLDGHHWRYVNTRNPTLDFYRWATASEDPGIKLYYTALALENAGHIRHAIKAYYALIVHFPQSVGLTFWGTPWYVGPASLDKINVLTRQHPELGIKLVDAYMRVENRYDDDRRNDVFVVDPGKLIRCPPEEVAPPPVDLETLTISQTKQFGRMELLKFDNGDWQLRIDGQPHMIKAVAYQPTMIGQSPDLGTVEDWTTMDKNANGLIDSPYDAWVDHNRNNIQDEDEPAIGDFQLLQHMGVNAIRVYHHGFLANKEIFRALYEDYGIYTIMGDYLGMYAVGSKAPWIPGTNYSDKEQQQNMLASVTEMIETYKDEPCILMWMLGNENNYGTANNAKDDPHPYYRFVNQAAKHIKELDATRPVAICNGDIHFLDIFAAECPDVDIFGTNTYRGKQGFGYFNFWLPIRELADRPVLITEYGAPAYGRGYSRAEAEQFQAYYLVGNWTDMAHNSAGHGRAGNSIGGVLFQWLDEWWKTGAPPGYPDTVQDTLSNHAGPFIDGWYYEEWFGVASQGDGTASPFMRQLRPAYYDLQALWREDVQL